MVVATIIFAIVGVASFTRLVSAEDFSFCHEIDFKQADDNCTDGEKYPILGDCKSFFKCDGLPTGIFLRQEGTVCPESRLFDRKLLECVEGKPEDLEKCDQKTCKTVFEAAGVEKLEQGDTRGTYSGQGSRPGQTSYNREDEKRTQPSRGPAPYPGDDQYNQPGRGQGGDTRYPADGNQVQPSRGQGHDEHSEREHGVSGQKDDKPRDEKKDQKIGKKTNGSSSVSSALAVFLGSVLASGIQNI